jgi:hypothetical protein
MVNGHVLPIPSIYYGSLFNSECIFTILRLTAGISIQGLATWPVWVHVVLTSLCRIVIPRQEILEYGAWVIKILCPPTPVADLLK